MQTQVNATKLLEEIEDFISNEVRLTSDSTLVDTGEEVYRRRIRQFIQHRKAALGVRTA